jgi:hypothetical protein
VAKRKTRRSSRSFEKEYRVIPPFVILAAEELDKYIGVTGKSSGPYYLDRYISAVPPGYAAIFAGG